MNEYNKTEIDSQIQRKKKKLVVIIGERKTGTGKIGVQTAMYKTDKQHGYFAYPCFLFA